ncbi:glycerol-3-phosphate dehydrogenase (NAD(P)(+)) [Maritalea myrionectae]|uniref:Glycerol-3-phosphate dehydrogenase [NAD(P)+] n=1 Tax=Maritalea myrionectae TaxID=454601 RepID=A0A2R4MA87_9HYPH|nr:NAD(P)H-dependent glycerol-3-phosphate dehydrogenase [Maritalea myrionectae]AVX02957.1 glycerol-3-phosphate dehydrogenase (NAD(P)(+)) [Maritalea myrionectae]
MSEKPIFVVGAGAWGSALAHMLGLGGNRVVLCGRDDVAIRTINEERRNPHYLKTVEMDSHVQAQLGYEGIEAALAVLLVVPAQASRAVLAEIGADRLAGMPVVLCAKGLEKQTLERQSEILAEACPKAVPFVLSGPSFAVDVAQGKPTAVTLAGPNIEAARQIVDVLAGPTFRPYSSDDIVGVELAGALKNIYALACGAVDGAQLGLSARSSIMARAFAEMGPLIAAMGGQRESLNSLAGLGDLTLSCTARESRNFDFGFRLGAGETVEQIVKSGAKLAEGVHSSPVGLELAKKYQVEAPIIAAVNALLQGEAPIESLVAQLMTRPLRSE